MEILFLNRLNGYWETKLTALGKEFPQVKFIKNNNPEDRINCLKTADAVVSGRLSEVDIENAPKLKVLFVPFAGLDNFALKKLKEKNIIISNTHANYNIVAERGAALALSLLGRVVEFHNELKKGYWHMSIEQHDMWTTIQRKTCGILGLGHIGKCLAKFLKAFDCNVIGFKKHKTPALPENVNEVSTDLYYVIRKSEIIFICLPLNKETKHIINSSNINLLKDKYLINIARGEIIEEEALYNALKNGTIKGAGLDVWYNYPGRNKKEPVFPSNKPIYELPNVVLSPHKSSHTIDAINSMTDDTIENIRSYILKGKPKVIVNKNLMY